MLGDTSMWYLHDGPYRVPDDVEWDAGLGDWTYWWHCHGCGQLFDAPMECCPWCPLDFYQAHYPPDAEANEPRMPHVKME